MSLTAMVSAVPGRSPERQAELDAAVAAVDRELAADLEMLAMFDTTRHAVVLENGQFLRHREVIARELPEAHAVIAALYERIPAAESAMERRGPAGSIRDEDRTLVNEWEGDARVAQQALRAAARTAPRPPWARLIAKAVSVLRAAVGRSAPRP